MQSINNVDEYIANTPKAIQGKLKELRAVIRKMAPTAEERISYCMPYYSYKGRLVYFAAFNNHIGLYLPPPIIEEHQQELNDYGTSKSAIRFPFDKKLPVALIKKLVKARMKKNEATEKKKLL